MGPLDLSFGGMAITSLYPVFSVELSPFLLVVCSQSLLQQDSLQCVFWVHLALVSLCL